MKKLKVAVIGCGGIANQKHFPALKNNSDMNEIVAFCDVIEERAVKAAKEFGTPDAKVYTDYRELLKDESIEVVHICTQTCLIVRLLSQHLKLRKMYIVKNQCLTAQKKPKRW